MASMATMDLDYVCARLHARRSRAAEKKRLDALCQHRAIPELSRALRPEYHFQTAKDFQRQLLQDLVREFSFCLRHLDGPEHELVGWMQRRFQIENIKVLLRGVLNHTPFDILQEHLVPLPRELELDTEFLPGTETMEAFAKRLPSGWPQKQLQAAVIVHHDPPCAFIFEAALDSGYFRELIERLDRLPAAEQELIAPIIWQQVDMFHLMLAGRGKFHHELATESLFPLHVPGCGTAAERFKDMLDAPDLASSAKLSLGHGIDELPAATLDAATLEALGWRRFLRLANGAFRRSHMGLAAVVGYLEIRRVEAANLTTLSEGIRTGVEVEKIRSRLIPRTDREADYV